MVNAVLLVADWADEELLLDQLHEPAHVQLREWPEIDVAAPPMPRAARAGHSRLAVVDSSTWPPHLVAVPGTVDDPDHLPPIGFLARHRRSPPPLPAAGSTIGWLDSERASFMLWTRRELANGLVVASIGSQADHPEAIGADYVRWVRRTQSWVRRRGVRIWGLASPQPRPDLAVRFGHVSTVWALPGALAGLEAGASIQA